jgi:putative tryptophan/tyrosine transport system substrate-binding protein
MRRREFISVIAGATAWPLAARAQQPATPVIGILSEVHLLPDLIAAFQGTRAEAGYVEGKNLAIEYRFPEDRPEGLPNAAGDLVRLNVNVIFAAAPAALAAAKNATANIPVVGVDLESDPVAMGYVKSLARPGGNVTGVFLDIPELFGKQLGLLKEVFPRLSRIAIFGVHGLNAPQFAATETAARAFAVETEIMEVRVLDDFEGALEAARTRHVEAGILLSSPLVFVSSKQIGELAIAKRLPLISLFPQFPKAGGFMAYGPNLVDLFRTCGDCAQHQEGVGKTRCGSTVYFEVADSEFTRAQLDRRQVIDINFAVACQARSQEQGDVVAPRHEWLLEEFDLIAAKRHEGGERVRLVAAKSKPTFHIDPAEQEHCVHAVVYVVGVDIRLTVCA